MIYNVKKFVLFVKLVLKDNYYDKLSILHTMSNKILGIELLSKNVLKPSEYRILKGPIFQE